MKTIEFPIPDGYIHDKDKSTSKSIVFKYAKSDNVMERIKNFYDALAELPADGYDVAEYNKLITNPTNARFINFAKLIIIAKALNEGWKPDWNDTDQYKYYNWFNINNGTFSYVSTNYIVSSMIVPSALFLKSEALAKYVAKIAFEEYKAYLTK